jgi:hypothetical protein
MRKKREEEGDRSSPTPIVTPRPSKKRDGGEVTPLPEPTPQPSTPDQSKPTTPAEKPDAKKPTPSKPGVGEDSDPAKKKAAEEPKKEFKVIVEGDAAIEAAVGKVVTIETARHDEPDWYEVKLTGVIKLPNDRIGTLRYEDDKGKPKAIDMVKVKRVRIEEQILFETATGKRERETIATWKIKPWPQLTKKQHADEVRAIKAEVDKVIVRFPDVRMTETANFVFATNIP